MTQHLLLVLTGINYVFLNQNINRALKMSTFF